MELQSGYHDNSVTSSVTASSPGPQCKTVVSAKLATSSSLPKRAETFTAFDSKQKLSGNINIVCIAL